MNRSRFDSLAARYPGLRVALIGDFCLDRYLEINPDKSETSIETGLPVHNVVRIRSQPGGAGTILNNLVALGIGQIFAVGFCGEDGEGFELRRALSQKSGVAMDYFLATPERHTFTYTKPLLVRPSQPPVELNRLDIKNWSETPEAVRDHFHHAVRQLAHRVDAFILLDQVDIADTGVVTSHLLQTIRDMAEANPRLPILADSRRSLASFPKVIFKMNNAELARMSGDQPALDPAKTREQATHLAQAQTQPVFVTMAERGIVGASPSGDSFHLPALPVRGEIDIVGAGDAVTANLAAALIAGAELPEAMELAMAAASLVIHQLGTTGTASVAQIRDLATTA